MRKNNFKEHTYVILHNIRSAYNVGSVFRTADAAGVFKIYLTGLTPTPLDRFGKKRKDIHKTALGAEDEVLWEYKKNIGPLLVTLKKAGVCIIGVEQAKDAQHYRKIQAQKRAVAFLFGNEVKGLSKNILSKCDTVAEIPMRGAKESLNVSVAVGVMLFR